MKNALDLFVIGGGSAGVRLARVAARHGARVAIAEHRHWGGTCVNLGCVPKKFMVMAAEYGVSVQDAAGFGWLVESARHDWARLIAAKNREIDRLSALYRATLEQAGVRPIDARARLTGPHSIEAGGQTFTAERLAIATGGHPLRPPIPGAEYGIVSDDAFSLPLLPRRIAIIGSGYIAVEFAGIFAGLGAETHLFYRQPLPLRGFDGDLRAGMAEALAAQGVTLHPKSLPERIALSGERRLLVLPGGEKFTTDCVFLATGRGPSSAGLGLEAQGVALAPNGAVLVNDWLQTNLAHVYALGDVTERRKLTPVATAEGQALADTLFGNQPRRIELTGVPSAVFSIPPLATVGLNEEEAQARGPVDIYLSRFTPLRHALTGRERKTLMKLVVDQPTGRILGAHMLGEDAPEIIQGFAAAITAGARKADLDATIGIHPTAAEEFVTMRSRTRSAGAEAA